MQRTATEELLGTRGVVAVVYALEPLRGRLGVAHAAAPLLAADVLDPQRALQRRQVLRM